jgi:hypothetical protein
MKKFAVAFFFAVLASAPAYAQSMIGGSLDADAVISTGQSAQIALPRLDLMFRRELLTVFVLDCVIVLAVSSAIVFHPVRIRARRNVRDLELPRLFLMYGLIGMAIGFLVLQYGVSCPPVRRRNWFRGFRYWRPASISFCPPQFDQHGRGHPRNPPWLVRGA